jgi:two-component system, OmpR family, phosphate regulon sensor histidine kinase PhoR
MRIKLHNKITGATLLVIIVILAGIFLFLQKSFEEKTLARITSEMRKETALARSYILARLKSDMTLADYHSLAHTIGSDIEVRATIIARDGRVLGDSELTLEEVATVENHADRPEVREALEAGYGQSRRFSVTVKKDLFYSARFFSGYGQDGVIRLAMPLADIDFIHSRIRTVLAVSLFMAFVIAIIFSIVSSYLISRPIKEMAYMAKSIAMGNFERKIRIHTNDEVEDLAQAFNQMAKQVRMRIEEVTSGKLRLEAILHSMFDGVMVVDEKGVIVMINNTLKKMLHIDDEPAGKKPIEIIRNVEIQTIVDSIIAKKTGLRSQEISLVLPEEKILMIHATPVMRSGATDGAVLVFHDVTDLKRLEAVRRDFVANVSHELRTPLSTIKGYAETLIDGAINDAENAHEFVKIIYDDANRLALLVNDLLDLSKLESGKFVLEFDEVALKPIVEQVLSGLRKSAAMKKLAVSCYIPDALAKVKADESRISQVLLNLVDNAIKYTPEGGSVSIEVIEKQDSILVDIKDSGIGIPEKDIPRIFERFYRVDKGRSRMLGGTGLGLSIVKHIIQSHGGNVFVESVFGQGSTFSFTLPKV